MTDHEEEKQGEHIMAESPANPFNVMTEGAVGLHEMYLSYKEAGFTRSEALELIARIMSYSVKDTDLPPE